MKRLIAALLCVCFAVAGCTKENGTGPSGTPAARSVLHVNNYADPTSLNPLLATNTAENFVNSLIFDMLVTLDDHQKEVPDLAQTVPTLENGGISRDGLTITYHLRHNVKWQDGAPFTSADVKFSWQAIMNPQNNVVERRGYDQVASVDTPDPYTVVFHLKQRFAPFVDTVFAESDDPFRIVPKHLLAQYPNINRVPFNNQPIGTGPFKVVRWLHGDHIELVANDKYFRGKPRLSGIDVYTVTDGNTSESEIRAHDTDLVIDIPTANLAHLRNVPGVKTLLVKAPTYYSIAINTSHPPLDDVRVRRAIAYGIDEQRLVQNVTYGTAVPAVADLSDFYWAFDPHAGAIDYDAKAAANLLDQAGWRMGPGGIRQKNGKRLSLQLVYGTGSATAQQTGVIVQSDLRQVGIDVSIKTFTYEMLYATMALGGILNSGKYDLSVYAWVSGADPDDSSQWMCSTFPPNGNNISRYCNSQMDAEEHIALTHFDRATRKRAYAQTQRLLLRDVPSAFNYYQRLRYALSPNLQNFSPNGVSEGWNAYEWSIKR
jgi:peptide/nickel transport system substrate-binding protein